MRVCVWGMSTDTCLCVPEHVCLQVPCTCVSMPEYAHVCVCRCACGWVSVREEEVEVCV